MKANTTLVIAAVVIIVAIAGGYYALQSNAPTTTTQVTTVTTTATTTTSEERLKVALVLPGSITDAGWNAAWYTGAQNAEKAMNLDMDISYGLGQVGLDATFRSYAERGYQVIIGASVGYQDSVLRVAPDFPDTWFIGMDFWAFGDLPNVFSTQSPVHEGAYLAGIAAAGVTTTGTVGFLDGEKYPNMLATSEAFKMGAEAGAEVLGTTITVVRDFAGVWDDVTAGREKALALIDVGADVIQMRGDGVTLGGIQACSLRGVYAIGDMTDQHSLAADTIVTSNMWLTDAWLEQVIELYQTGGLTPGHHVWGMADGVNDIAPFYGFADTIPQSIQDKIDQVRADVIAGTFEIPWIGEELAW
jgi:basic membrane protein A and related proteins